MRISTGRQTTSTRERFDGPHRRPTARWRPWICGVFIVVALALIGAACSSDSTVDTGDSADGTTTPTAAEPSAAEPTPAPTEPDTSLPTVTAVATTAPTVTPEPAAPTTAPTATAPPAPTATPEPQPTPPPLPTLAPVADADHHGLAGTHGLTLQWISWEPSEWGRVEFVPLVDGTYHVSGRQDGIDGDYVSLDGTMSVVNDRELLFDGLVSMQISHNNDGRPCDRRGPVTFLATGERQFWRMQDLINCDGIVTDYVDIYFG